MKPGLTSSPLVSISSQQEAAIWRGLDQSTEVARGHISLNPRLTRRRFLQAACISAAGFGLYSSEIARHRLEVVYKLIALRDLPAPFHGFRIVQISDIHFEEFTEAFFLHSIINRVNELAPDLVLITGDFITHGPPRSRPERAIFPCAEALRAITCPIRLGVLGNHDVAVGANLVTRVLESHGTPVLTNRYVNLERLGSTLTIAGLSDPSTTIPNLAQALPAKPTGPTILMAHAPDYADSLIQYPIASQVGIMLSGHSHGGQVRLPLIGPTILPPMGKKYVQGHFNFGSLQLYVNRGLGSVGLPFRLNCPPEITVLTLNPA